MNSPCPADKYRLIAEINMVPLIDVALVLLIIFMVITPILVKASITVALPGAASATTEQDAAALISIDAAGSFTFAGEAVDREGLASRLRVLAASPGASLRIAADKQADFDAVVFAMDAARSAGLNRMSIAVHRQPSSGD